MPSFRNMADLNRYLKTRAGDVKMSDGRDLKTVLADEAVRLKGLVRKHIWLWYQSYSPVEYERTHNLVNTVRIAPVKQNGDEISVRVYFDHDEATYPSVFPGGEEGFVPILIDQGWRVKKDVWFRDIHMFGHFEGAGFVAAAVAEYNANNPFGFKVIVEITE